LAAWSSTMTDIRRLASRANAIAPSMMTRASASVIGDGVNGGGGLGACAKLVDPNVNSSDRLAIATARHDERNDFILTLPRIFWFIVIATVANAAPANKPADNQTSKMRTISALIAVPASVIKPLHLSRLRA
jgi:hypothetical protein